MSAPDQALLDVLERLRGRYFGKYRGTVTDVEEGGRARIKAKVPAVLGEQKTGWCDACVPYAGSKAGMVFLPEVGSGVWIEFEGGDISYPIWTGCYFRDGELPADAGPAKKLIVTPAGQQLLLDGDAESIEISDGHGNSVTLDSSGIALVRGGGKLELGESLVKVNDGALEVA